MTDDGLQQTIQVFILAVIMLDKLLIPLREVGAQLRRVVPSQGGVPVVKFVVVII